MRWDAGYCLVMGSVAVIAFRPVAEVIGAPRFLVAILGLGVLFWSGFVYLLSRVPSWRTATTIVMIGNLVAVGILLLGVILRSRSTASEVLLIGIALQVFGFAAVQMRALWLPAGR